jgi:hypothetical protein
MVLKDRCGAIAMRELRSPTGHWAHYRNCLKGAARLRPVRALGALLLIARSTSAVPG